MTNNIWLTADHHFGHANIIGYTSRPFSDIEEMDSQLIAEWNYVVQSNDIVYYLGDITLGGIYDMASYITELNGHIKIIPGNHDWRWLNDYHSSIIKSASGHLVILLSSIVDMKIDDQFISMCHYSMREWNRSFHGSLHFYGHSHSTLHYWQNSLDVGVDMAAKLLGQYRPFSFDEACHYAKKGY